MNWRRYAATACVLLICAFVLILGKIGIAAYNQHKAIQEIERLGGLIDTVPRAPAWIRTFVDPKLLDGFDWVKGIKMPTIRDDEMNRVCGYLSAFKGPCAVDLSFSDVTDQGLGEFEKLARVVKVTELNLRGTRITDDALYHLRDFRHIKILGMVHTRISGDGLVHLASLMELSELYLQGTSITDAMLPYVANCRRLKLLYLDETKVSDRGIRSLSALTALRILSVDETDVTDSGIRELQRLLPELRILASVQ